MSASITALDTRYSAEVQELVGVYDDFTYYKYRVCIELHWIKFLCKNGVITDVSITANAGLTQFIDQFTFHESHYVRIKEIEQTTRHDVKAIEYWLKEVLIPLEAPNIGLYIHLGLTSQDVNSLAFVVMFYNSVDLVITKLVQLMVEMDKLAVACEYRDVDCLEPLIALTFTHGQPAVPCRFSDQLRVYYYRLMNQVRVLTRLLSEVRCKFGGANGHHTALNYIRPDKDWAALSNEFVMVVGVQFGIENLVRSVVTTQCDDYDSVLNVLRVLQNCGVVLEAFRMNIWNYIARGYFAQANVVGEIGSSTMSHKINPIDIENARTMLEFAACDIDAFCRIVGVLQYQRDISDSSATRCLSSVFGYYLVAIGKIGSGIRRIVPNCGVITAELNANVAVVSEGLQVYLKYKCGVADAYERVAEVTKQTYMGVGGGDSNKTMVQRIYEFIASLDVSNEHKDKLVRYVMLIGSVQ